MSNWSGIKALGEMAQGGGKLFGTLYSQKLRTERLAQAHRVIRETP